MHVFTDDDLVPVTLVDGITLWGAAHRAPANTDGFLERFVADRGGVNLALFHGSEISALGFQETGKAPHAPFKAEQLESAHIDHAFLGHFHTPRDEDRYTYPGNPDPLTFGELGERGAVVCTVRENGTVDRTRHKVAVSQVHDLNVDLTGVAHAGQVRERVAAAVTGLHGVARVTLGGEVAPEVDVHLADLAGVAEHLEALVPRMGEVRVAYDFAALAEEPTVRGQFVRDVQAAAELDEETRRSVLVTGLRALDGRTSELGLY